MYQFESRVRYSESLQTGAMNPISISNYLQDCATFHSASLGKDIVYYKNENRGWLLNSWQIDISRYPKTNEKIVIATWSYGIKGFYGYRNFTIRDEQNQLCVCANSVWFFIDTTSGQPIRAPKEEAASYGSEQKFPMEYCSRKISLPKLLQPFPSYSVTDYDIDTNGHVNNVRYMELAFQYLPKAIQRSNHIWRIRAEYKKAAKLGDIIYPYGTKTALETPPVFPEGFFGEHSHKITDRNQYSFLLAAENLPDSTNAAGYANIIFYV